MGFEPDANIGLKAGAYASGAVDFARRHFGIKLDWTDASVRDVETILSHLHEEMLRVPFSKCEVLQFSKMFGSYVGEVLRRNHEACWGTVTWAGNRFHGMKTKSGDREYLPWGKVQKRILNGSEEDLWQYFQVLALS